MHKVLVVILFLMLLTTLTHVFSEEQPGTGFSTAMELKEGSYSFYMEGARAHFFKIWLDVNQILHITLRVPMYADFDLYLLNPDREVIERSILGRGYVERISYQASSSGYHYIVVTPFPGSRGPYSLQISVHDLPVRTVTVTVTKSIPTYEVIFRPAPMLVTVTKTIYETERTIEVRYVERVPWTMMGLIIIAISIMVSSAAVVRLLKTTRGEVSEHATS